MVSYQIATGGAAPGGGFRSDGSILNIGRDGRAVTAAIAPSIGDRVINLAEQAFTLYRERATRRSGAEYQRSLRSGNGGMPIEDSITDAAPFPEQAGPPSLLTGAGGMSIGALAVIGVIAFLILRR